MLYPSDAGDNAGSLGPVDSWVERWRGTDQAEQAAGICPELDVPPPVRLAEPPPLPATSEVRERQRGDRLARLVRRHGLVLRPVLAELLTDAVVEIVRELLVDELPDVLDALDVLRRRKGA